MVITVQVTPQKREAVTQTETQKHEFWRGKGAGSLKIVDYDLVKSSLAGRFGEKFLFIGQPYRTEKQNGWVVIFKAETTLTKEDLDFIRSLFPKSVNIQVWMVEEETTITILPVSPPLIDFDP
ncbi:MAG: hypothetical protein DRO43_05380 [Candidatus Hecatellales archaeon]|nr:MAG: hypothetical protein DRO43_05380 [Candidatus Hecatellales archaeon]